MSQALLGARYCVIHSPVLSSQDFVAPFYSKLKGRSSWSWCLAPGRPGTEAHGPSTHPPLGLEVES